MFIYNDWTCYDLPHRSPNGFLSLISSVFLWASQITPLRWYFYIFLKAKELGMSRDHSLLSEHTCMIIYQMRHRKCPLSSRKNTWQLNVNLQEQMDKVRHLDYETRYWIKEQSRFKSLCFKVLERLSRIHYLESWLCISIP